MHRSRPPLCLSSPLLSSTSPLFPPLLCSFLLRYSSSPWWSAPLTEALWNQWSLVRPCFFGEPPALGFWVKNWETEVSEASENGGIDFIPLGHHHSSSWISWISWHGTLPRMTEAGWPIEACWTPCLQPWPWHSAARHPVVGSTVWLWTRSSHPLKRSSVGIGSEDGLWPLDTLDTLDTFGRWFANWYENHFNSGTKSRNSTGLGSECRDFVITGW